MEKIKWGWELGKFKASQVLFGMEAGTEPWLDPETKQWHRERLAGCTSYMEFGSGGSTYLAGSLGIPTISVEGDATFAEAVRRGLPDGSKVTLIAAPIGFTGPWGVPVPGTASPSRLKKWRNYIDLPFLELVKSGLGFPQLALVDGRFRRACALRIAQEAKRAGAATTILFDDYFSEERTRYSEIEAILGEPERVGRSAIFSITGAEEVSAQQVEEALADFR